MTPAERLAGVTYNGIQYGSQPDHGLALCTDPLTGSTFALREGETLAEAMARFDRNWCACGGRIPEMEAV